MILRGLRVVEKSSSVPVEVAVLEEGTGGGRGSVRFPLPSSAPRMSLQPHGIQPQDESRWCREMCLPPRLGKGVTAGRETWEFQMDFQVRIQFLCLISTSVFAVKTRKSLVWQCYR